MGPTVRRLHLRAFRATLSMARRTRALMSAYCWRRSEY